MLRLEVLDLALKPQYPIILDIDGILYPIKDEKAFAWQVKPSDYNTSLAYLAIDSQGDSWHTTRINEFQIRIVVNVITSRITKKQFLNGFNSRKNNPKNEILNIKVTHKTFVQIFAEAYRILTS